MPDTQPMNEDSGTDKTRLTETPQRIFGSRTDRMEQILSEELGESYIAYRKEWVRASNREIVTEFPLYIQIEHSGKCNLHCPCCIQGIDPIRETYSAGFTPLDMALYRRILDEARSYHCPSISFHNNDEPLLLKDLAERIRLAKEAGFLDLIMVTNATLLTKERAEELLQAGITKINFSVDGWNREVYTRVRKGADFDAVLANITYFLERKKQLGMRLPVTRVTCVLSRFTIEEMEHFRDFWGPKVDAVEFQNFQAIRGYTEQFKPEGAVVNEHFVCNSPWQQVVIRANGDILPCCSFFGTELVLGNVGESSIHEIWHGPQMQQLREELMKSDYNPVCAKCAGTFYITN